MRLEYDDYNSDDISSLLGKTLKSILVDEKESITFVTTDDVTYIMHHEQSCCEHVEINDIYGDIQDLVGSPITLAKESSNSIDNTEEDYGEHVTWTFYKLATNKGYVDIRWYGSSNGYYSESVDFSRMK